MMNVEQIAMVCHEANRAYCKILGDDSQVSWDDAPDWQKESCALGVQAAIDDPKTSPEKSHQRWLDHKKASGWRYGPVKNVETKEHPCFVPYAELPTGQRIKDDLFLAVVRAIGVR